MKIREDEVFTTPDTLEKLLKMVERISPVKYAQNKSFASCKTPELRVLAYAVEELLKREIEKHK